MPLREARVRALRGPLRPGSAKSQVLVRKAWRFRLGRVLETGSAPICWEDRISVENRAVPDGWKQPHVGGTHLWGHMPQPHLHGTLRCPPAPALSRPGHKLL